MGSVLTLTAVWATAIAPQLCRIGALTACCAADAPQRPVPDRAEACAPGDCNHHCQRPEEAPASPAERDCGTCADFCAAVVKPHDSGEHTSHSHAKLLAGPPAASGGDNRRTNKPMQHPLLGTADLPRMPRPSSDFPLLL